MKSASSPTSSLNGLRLNRRRPLCSSIASQYRSARALAFTLSVGAAIASQFSPDFFGSRAEAAALYWDASSGTWQTDVDWTTDPTGTTISGSAVPGAGDSVFFNGSSINGDETIGINAATAALGITFQNTGATTIQDTTAGAQTLTIGTGGINILAGSGAVTIGNASQTVGIALSGAQTWTNNSTNAFTVVNGLSLGANALSFAGAGTFTINGIISGSTANGATALTIGTGTTVNLNGANTFTGDILVNGGTLAASMGNAASGALGGQIGTTFRTLNLTNGGTFVSNATFNDNVPSATNVGIVFNFGTGGGTLNVASGTTLTIDDGSGTGTASTAAELQGSGTLTKTGNGKLILGYQTNNFSNFTGAIVISAGTLAIGGNSGGTNPLGSTTAGTTIASGANFDLAGSANTAAEPLSISGAGFGGNGVIFSSSTTASSFAGPITLLGDATVGAAASGAITLSGGITGTANFTVSNSSTGGMTLTSLNNTGIFTNSGTGTGTTTINSIGANVQGIVQSGASPLTIAGAYPFATFGYTLTNSGTGLYTISSGVTGTGNLVLNALSGGGITLSTTAVNNAGTITNSGTGTGTSTISAAIGSNVTNVLENSATSQLTLSSASNAYTGTTTIQSGILSVGNVVVAAGVSGLGNSTTPVVLGGATTSGTLSYTGAAATYTRGFTINVGGGEIDSTANTLTINTPVALTNGPLTIGGSSNVTFSTTTQNNFTGTNALTKVGTGTLTLTTTTAAATAAAMPIFIKAGTLVSNATGTSVSPLGTGTITITPGATLSYSENGQTGVTASNPFVIANASGTANISISSGGINNSGPVSFAAGSNTPTLKLNNTNGTAATLTFSGGFTGTGNIQLNPSNTGAPITISSTSVNNAGTITNVGSSTSLSLISATIGSNVTGVSQAGANPFTISSALTLNSNLNSFTSTGTGLWTFSGAISGAQNLTFNANSNGAITIGAINNAGLITNSGTGGGTVTVTGNIGANVTSLIQNAPSSILTLSGTNTYSGTTNVNAGVLDILNTISLPQYASGPSFGAITVGNGGTLGLGFGAATGQFTATDIANIISGVSPVHFAASGSSLGVDTTSATSGISLTTIISNPAGVSLGFAKLGSNTLTVNSANTYTGPTSIVGGTLSVGMINSVVGGSAASDLGAPTTVANGTISLGLGVSTGQLTYTGPGETTDRVINLAGTTGGGTIDQSGSGLLKFTSNFAFTGTGAKTLTLQGSTTGNGEISGTIAGGAVGSATPLTITKAGTNTWTLSGAGNTAQNIIISGGTLDFGPNGIVLNDGTGTNINATGTSTINGKITLGGTSVAGNGGDFGAASGSTLTLNSVIADGAAGTALGIDFYNGSLGTTILTGASTYSIAQTNIGQQIVQVSSINSVATNAALGTMHSASSNLGAPTTVAAGTILLATSGASTLKYVGTGETTDRVISLGNNAGVATIDQSGTGLLKFVSSFTNIATVAKTLQLQGSTSGTGEIAGALPDNGTNKLSLIKAGTGTWTLSGANTYTGATAINGGNLILASTGTLANTAISINAGGIFSPVAGVTVGNTATAAAGATLTLAAGGLLNLADGNIGTFTIAQGSTFTGTGLTLSGGTINFDLGNTTADLLVATKGAATGSNLIWLNTAGITSLTVGQTYTLISAAGAGSTLNGGTYAISDPTFVLGGVAYNFGISSTANAVTLTVNSGITAPTSAYWLGGIDGSWKTQNGTTLATNFTADAAGTVNTLALPSSGTNVFFTANSASNFTQTTLDGNVTINSLNFTGTGTSNAAGTTIASGAAGPFALTINGSAANGNAAGNGISVASGSGPIAITSNVVLGGSQTWTNNSTSALTVSGNISDGGSAYALTVAGAGQLVLTGTNTYSGGTTIAGGVLTFSSGSLGSGAIAMNGGTLQWATGNTLDITSAGRSITFGGTAVFDTNGNNVTLAGPIGGTAAFGLTKNGNGTLYLQGTNNFGNDSNITINAGTLKVDSAANLGATTNNIYFSNTGPSTLEFTGSTTIGSGMYFRVGAGQPAIFQVDSGLVVINSTTTGSATNGINNGGTSNLSSVVKTGPGTLQLNGSQSYMDGSGGFVIQQGTLSAAGTSNAVFGDGNPAAVAVHLAGGTLSFDTDTANIDLAQTSLEANGTIINNRATAGSAGISQNINALTVQGNYTLSLQAGANVTSGTATIVAGATTLNGAPTFNIQNNGLGATTQFTLGAVTNNSNTITVTGNGNLVISGAIAAGSGGLTLDSNFSGIATLSGANAYTGLTTVNGGQLVVGSGTNGTLGANNVSVANGASLVFARTNAMTVSNVISGAGSVIQNGAGGTTSLAGLNTYTGPTIINAGTLSASFLASGGQASSIGQATGDAANLVLNGGTLQYTGTGAIFNRNYTFGNATTGAGGGFDAEGTGALVIAGAMSPINTVAGTQVLTLTAGTGTGSNIFSGSIADSSATALIGLTKAGAGLWILSGSDTYSGTTTVSAGTLQLSGTGTLGNGNAPLAMAGGTVDLNGTNQTVGSLTGTSGTILNNSGSGVSMLTIGGATTSYTGTIKDNTTGTGSVAVTITGQGTFGTANSYSGGTTINGDPSINPYLQLTNVAGAGTGPIAVNSGNGLLLATSGTFANNISGAGYVENYNSAATAFTLSGNLTYTGPTLFRTAASTITFSPSVDSTLSGPIGTAGAGFGGSSVSGGIVTKTGTATLTLTGANVYTGATTVSAGTLALANGGSLGNTAITVATGATFAARAGTGSLFAGSTGSSNVGATLTVSGGTFSMVDGSIGTFNLNQNSGFSTTPLNLNAAILNFDIGSGGADQLVVSGGTGNATLANISTINFTPIESTLGNSTNTFPLISAKGISATSTNNFRFSNGGLTQAVNVGGTSYLLTLVGTTGQLGVTVASKLSLSWTGQTNGTDAANSNWNIASGDANFAYGTTATDYIEGVIVNFQDTNTVTGAAVTNTNVVVPAGGVNPAAVVVNSALNYTFSNASGTVGITGATGLTKLGSGTLTLLGNNSYTDSTAINGGVMNLGVAQGTGYGPLGNNGTISFGGGTLQYSAANQYDYSSRFSTAAGQAYSIDTNGQSVTYATALTSPGGTLTKVGNGTLTLNGVNTYSGNTTINGGTLTIAGANGSSGALASPVITINAGGTLNLTNSDTLGYTAGRNALVINGGTVLNNAAGKRDTILNVITMVGGALAGTSVGDANTGAFSLDQGSVIATSDSAGNPATISANISLQINNTFTVNPGANTPSGGSDLLISGPITPYNNGTNSVTKAGNGVMTLSGANTYKGGTIILGGNIYVGNNTALGVATAALTMGDITGNAGTLDLKNFSQTIGSLVVNTSSNTKSDSIVIHSGNALNINGNVTIGPASPTATQTSKLTMSGGGALVVTSTGGTFQVGGSTTTVTGANGDASVLDLTGLGSATINLGSTGTVRVNNPQSGNTAGVMSTLYFPTPVTTAGTAVTTITAANFNVGDNSSNQGSDGQINSAVLGTGLTALNVNTVNIGTGGRDLGSLTFAAGNGSIVLRAADGAGRATFNLGTGGATTGVATGAGVTGSIADFTGHNADLLISTLNVGNQSRNSNITADFKFDTGTLDATGVTVGFDTAAVGTATVNPVLTDTVTIGGGTVTIGSGGLDMGSITDTNGGGRSIIGNFNVTGGTVNIAGTGVFAVRLGNNTSGTGTVTTSDTLSVTGGTVTLGGDVIAGTVNRTTSNVTLDGGTLDLGGHNIGSALTPITNLNFRSGTLQNVNSINGGAGLTKTGTGTLTIAGTNNYTGPTNVTSGKVVVSGSLTATTSTAISVGASFFANGSVNGPVSVSGGTVGGIGTISGSLTSSGGTVAPGNGAGVAGLLTVNSGLNLDSASTLSISLTSAANFGQISATSYNLGSSSGPGATLSLTLGGGYVPSDNTAFVIGLNSGGAITTVFQNTFTDSSPSFFNNTPFTAVWDTTHTHEFALIYNSSAAGFTPGAGSNIALLAVPEPNTAATLIMGLGSLIGLQRFRRRSGLRAE